MVIRIAFLIFSILSVFTAPGFAQYKIGSWRSHLPYSNASKLVLAGDKVFCNTLGGLFYYNRLDKSIDKLSKENGLSDTEVSAMAYSEVTGTTILAYANSNIDLLVNNSIYNIPDIFRHQILGDKRIYSIMVQGNKAYLCTGFGVVVLDLTSREITQTYRIGDGGTQIKVNEISSDGQSLFAATDQGIYTASLSAPNLEDFNYWQRMTGIPQFDQKFSSTEFINGKVYVVYSSGIVDGDIIYSWNGTNWESFSDLMKLNSAYIGDNINHLSDWNGNIVITGSYHVHVFNPGGFRIKFYSAGSPKCAYFDNSSILWVADESQGLREFIDEYNYSVLTPNGPTTIYVASIAISGNTLYTVPGGKNSDYTNLYRQGTINTFKSNLWSGKKSTSYRDFYRVAIDPLDADHYFVGSWGYGLFEYQNDSLINVYREENSTLQTIIPGDFYRLGGLNFDAEGNLWVTNSIVSEPVSVLLKKNHEWTSFSLNNLVSSYNMGDIIHTQSGYKWMILNIAKGLFVIDDNGTIENKDDDRYKKLDVKDEFNAIITNDINALAEDHDGNIWLGTNKGVLVYYNPSRVFEDNNFYAQQILIPRNDGSPYGDALLGTETVTAIAVDGANRKWLGTRNAGVTLVSEDGLKQIYNFTSENSPLLSNSITSIAINDKTGEVFFGTDKGIISFVAEATGPSENFESVFVYPNPVRENFTGDVKITGLPEKTTVKITDINGNIVYESLSLGGQALWNGKNFDGDKVQTGVYLIFCSNEDGTLSHVTKLLFIH
ncbi:MAG: T9SS type A sorting domain-containing protein [Bacteroidales bacterium]|nr:T9SS type A sorting domain-containing protein [Bacteroidales bacterium]MCB8998728.1 T9SS type A sorting domain-containing protein [Bacteroidales bacterium]